jgi:hypothetical protein
VNLAAVADDDAADGGGGGGVLVVVECALAAAGVGVGVAVAVVVVAAEVHIFVVVVAVTGENGSGYHPSIAVAVVAVAAMDSCNLVEVDGVVVAVAVAAGVLQLVRGRHSRLMVVGICLAAEPMWVEGVVEQMLLVCVSCVAVLGYKKACESACPVMEPRRFHDTAAAQALNDQEVEMEHVGYAVAVRACDTGMRA